MNYPNTALNSKSNTWFLIFLSLFMVLSCSSSFAKVAKKIPAISLKDAVMSAYKSHESINIERSRLEKSKIDKLQSYMNFAPDVSYSMSHTMISEQKEGDRGAGNARSKSKSLSLNQELFSGGATTLGVLIAKEQYMSQMASYDKAKNDLFSAVTSAYEDVLTNRSLLNYAKESERRFLKHVELADAKFKLGESSKTDLETAKAKLSGAKSRVAEARAGLLIANSKFENLVGCAPPIKMKEISLKGVDMPKNYTSFASITQQKNPEITKAMRDLKVAKHALGTTISKFSPKASVSAKRAWTETEYTRLQSKKEKSTDTVSLTLTAPIFERGTRYTLHQKTKKDLRIAKENLQQVKRRVMQNASQLWSSYKSTISILKSDLSVIKSSELQLDGMKQELALGARPMTDVLDAENQLFRAESDYRTHLAQQRKSIYSILSLMNLLDVKSGTVLNHDIKLPMKKEKKKIRLRILDKDGTTDLRNKKKGVVKKRLEIKEAADISIESTNLQKTDI